MQCFHDIYINGRYTYSLQSSARSASYFVHALVTGRFQGISILSENPWCEIQNDSYCATASSGPRKWLWAEMNDA